MPAPLPDCKLDIIKKYLDSLGFSKAEGLGIEGREAWVSDDGFNMVWVNVEEDPMYFGNVVGLVEGQLRKPIYEIPFYAAHIADRFDPEGRGPC